MIDPFNQTLPAGLNDEQVSAQRDADGFNELPTSGRHSLLQQMSTVVREPMILLLLACGALYITLGDLQESIALLISVFVIIGITLRQERNTERALEALRDLSSPRALVVRSGQKIRIAGREVVRGDIVLISEGDRIPADAIILQCNNLTVDESMLTGESVPVSKRAMNALTSESPEPASDKRLQEIYSGTLVVKGQAVARVVATGVRSELGRLGKMLQILAPEPSELQRQTRVLVRRIAAVGLGLCVMIVVVYGATRGDWLRGLLAGLSAAMSIMPEEFPVVLTVFLAMGAWRLSRHKMLTRRVPAVEALGATTVLCVDKTGTMTENRMRVQTLCVAGQDLDLQTIPQILPEIFHEVVEYSILASPSDPFDPMERAMRDLGQTALAGTEHLHADWQLLREYPLSEELLAMSRVWKARTGEQYIIAAKGAPEAIADLCHLDAERLQALHADVERLSGRGLRMIGVAQARFTGHDLPKIQHDYDFEFVGLLGLADPIRDEVPQAVAECHSAGIRVIMITGDHPGTAKSIARQAGLIEPENILMGPEIISLNDAELAERLRNVNVCARTLPEHKLRIVQVLKQAGEVVAMTGDGVNDAPALKAASIGIAMGGRGTDVAREAAALVLLDDNFASIVAAVRAGRLIYENLRKAMLYIFSVHIPIAGFALLPVLFKWPLALFPVHILFIEMIVDPASSLVFERELAEEDLMKRPPRAAKAAVFSRDMVRAGSLAGMVSLITVIVFYGMELALGRTEEHARALAFVLLIAGNLLLILSNRSFHRSLFSTLRLPNKIFLGVSGGASLFLVASVTIPWLSRFFHLAPLNLGDGLQILGTLAAMTGVFELMHRLRRGPQNEARADPQEI